MGSATINGQSKKISERIRTQPFFPAEGEHSFYATLKERVKPLFVTHGENVRRKTLFKVITYPTLYLLAYVGLLICGGQLIWLYMFYITLGLLVTLNVFKGISKNSILTFSNWRRTKVEVEKEGFLEMPLT